MDCIGCPPLRSSIFFAADHNDSSKRGKPEKAEKMLENLSGDQ
jgi:hypothetical protein